MYIRDYTNSAQYRADLAASIKGFLENPSSKITANRAKNKATGVSSSLAYLFHDLHHFLGACTTLEQDCYYCGQDTNLWDVLLLRAPLVAREGPLGSFMEVIGPYRPRLKRADVIAKIKKPEMTKDQGPGQEEAWSAFRKDSAKWRHKKRIEERRYLELLLQETEKQMWSRFAGGFTPGEIWN